MSSEESLRSLSVDYLNLLINGQAFSDVAFSVDGRLVHAHRCVLAARNLFFHRLFCSPDPPPGINLLDLNRHDHHHQLSPRSPSGPATGRVGVNAGMVIPLNSVGYEAFLLLLQFLYSGQVSVVPPKNEPRPDCSDRGCGHTHCTSAINLALNTIATARAFGAQELALITQKQLESMVEKASIKDVMKVLMASHKQDMHQLWTTSSHLIADSGLPPGVLSKHLPIDIVAKIEELRLKPGRHSFLTHHSHPTHHYFPAASPTAGPDDHHKIHRMRRALDSSDIDLLKLMVMGEGLDLNNALAVHYAVQNCSREVVKALLELGAADVNCPAGPAGKTPLHIAAEMVNPDMVSVLLDHHADPNVRTIDGVTPLDILRNLTSDFLFKGAVPGLSHIEPNRLRLCLELVQSAAMVLSREEEAAAAATAASATGGGASGGSNLNTAIYQSMSTEGSDCNTASNTDSSMASLSLDSRMVYLNLGMAAASHLGCNIGDGRQGSNGSRSQGGGEIGPSSMFSHQDFP